LNLQSGYVEDEKTLQILQESQTRIKAMSYIHETLYQTSDFSAIDFTEYMNTLVQNLIRSYNTSYIDLILEKDLDQIELVLDHSIPCGLIVNELITNCMKYAFEGIKNPKLMVSLKQKKDLISIRVADNGVGLPKDFKYEEADSLGIQLVYTLVEQLKGNIEINTKSGTEFLITFDKSLI
jgi:two-component sensor histidine kinase